QRAPPPIELLSTCDPRRTERLSTISGGNGSADREMVCQFASTNGVKHVTVHSGFHGEILLIQIILTRKNILVKRKIGNLFETKPDDGKLSRRGEVFLMTVRIGSIGKMLISIWAAKRA